MAEATKERERTAEQAFQRAEDTIGTMMENNRRTVQTMVEFNMNSFNTTYEFARNVQDESLRLSEAWLDHISRFQKSYFKSVQDVATRMQDLTEKVVKENRERVEETLDQSLEAVAPGSRHKRR